jgi:hypothetical protein
MKNVPLSLSLLAGALLSLSAHATGFANKTPAFDAPGTGDAAREYTIVVPAGCSITTRTGEVINAGETVGIPGEYIKLLEPEVAQPIIEGGYGFNSQSDFAKASTQLNEFAVIELTVPEGFKISHEDGTTIAGPRRVELMVTAANMAVNPEDTRDIRKAPAGFQSK